ncbi:site-2 protease family protein [Fervidobacterium islandicum]|uniref:Site-2 protease family protein n=1 Tax=Fervidobacterium islandicum TaxID=2423 RepID=A0AAI8CNK4_FERIS|nr:site-2 protease family protein [Fervidobacterium islandicum]AMW33761.1 site-2 protease family protein [Fervidobacterium islandicum]
MNQLISSLLKNVLYGFAAYILISWPRELLRCVFYRISFGRERTTNKLFPFLKKSLIGYVDPIGVLTFLFFDFGWTKPPLVDYIKVRRKKLFLFSLYGILASFLLGLIYGMASRFSNSPILFNLLYLSSKWSFTLGVISLIPFPPLDSSRMVLAFLTDKSYEWYIKFQFYGILFMLGLLVLWILPMIMHPLVIFITNVTNFIVFGNW